MVTRQEYIEDRVERIPWSGCWIWTKSISSNGYGNACDPVTGRVTTAHRLSFVAFHSASNANGLVCHRCDVRLCVNPEHLYLGSHADNMDDVARGRYHPRRKLGADHPEIIRRLLAEGVAQRKIANAFRVSQRAIQRIGEGRTYRYD